jgi:tRNA dimethylallyltransferase
MDGRQKVIAIVGPTASGKTALGIFLAKKCKGEVISADSRQIYTGMAAIARVPSIKERSGVPHYLLEFASPKRLYSAGEFKKAAQKILRGVEKRGRLPIVVGGAGFYVDSLLRGLELPEVPPNKKLRAQLAKKTPAQLFAQLKKLDPKTAARIDKHNPARLVRAIEIAKHLGKVPQLSYKPQHDVLWLGLRPGASAHEQAIRKGVVSRLPKMLSEAKKLRSTLTKKQLVQLGFELPPLLDYSDKKISRAELVERLVRAELGYVKRQMRWFKRRSDIVWVKDRKEALRRAQRFLSS